jgi:hypothetical protein
MKLEIIPVTFLYQIAPTINAVAFLNAATLIVGTIKLVMGKVIDFLLHNNIHFHIK